MQPNAPRHSPIDTPQAETPLNTAENMADKLQPPESVMAKIRRSGRRGAAAVVLGATLLTSGIIFQHKETVTAYGQLADKNLEYMFGEEPQFEFHKYTGQEALAATNQAFYLSDGLYLDNVSIDGPGSIKGFASAWHQYHVLEMLNAAKISNLNPDIDIEANHAEAAAATNTYWSDDPADFPGGYDANKNFGIGRYDRFVDDNLWLAQFLMQQYHQTGDEAHIEKAKEIIELFMSQRGPDDDGAFWKVQFEDEENRDKAIVSNATAIPILINLYISGHGEPYYLQVAEQTYDWLQQLKDPETGLYFDKFMGDGEIDESIYTYVQAMMLKSQIYMNKSDPEKYHLDDAIAFAELTLDYFAEHGFYGNSQFDSIYFRTMMPFVYELEDSVLIYKTRRAIYLARQAMLNSPNSIADAAANTAIIIYSELPTSYWVKFA